MSCDAITPISAFQSTNLNSKIDSFNRLGERIVRSLGAPLVSVELHQDQIFENISLACEMFSKFAGYSKEYLVFDSALYERGKGTRLDVLYTLSNQTLSLEDKLKHRTTSQSTSPYLNVPENVYIVSCPISNTVFSSNSTLSASFFSNLEKNQILDKATFEVLKNNLNFSNLFSKSSTSYVVVTGYHTALNNIPNSIFSSNSALDELYPSGIVINEILNDTNYSELSNFTIYIPISNYFNQSTEYLNLYRIASPIPDTIFLENENLSSVYQTGISSLTSISDTQFEYISSNLSNISLYNFLSSYSIVYYLISHSLCSHMFSSYENLSSEFNLGLYETQTLAESGINLIENEIVSGFPINLYFQLSVLSSYNSIHQIPSNVFLDVESLSDTYGVTGIQSDQNISKNNYDTILSNLSNISLNYFLSSQNISSYSVNTSIFSSVFLNYENLSAPYIYGLSASTIIYENDINLINSNANPGFLLSSFITELSVDSYKVISDIPANLFLDIESLSETYGTTGLLSDTILDTTEFSNISSNITYVQFRYYYDLHNVETEYTLINNVSTSLVSSYPSLQALYPEGLSAGLVLNSTDYNSITSIIDPGFDFNYFFTLSTLTAYFCVNDIPRNAFLDTPSLSDMYGSEGIIKDTQISTTDYDFIVSNLSSVEFNYYYLYDHNELFYDVLTPLSAEIFLNYSTLSSIYPSGIDENYTLNQTEYDYLYDEISGVFQITDFFKLSVIPYIIYTNTESLCPVLFLNSNILSSTYIDGISSGTILSESQYSILSSNFDSSINNYLSSTPQSGLHYNYFFTSLNYIHKDFTNETLLSATYPNGIALNVTINENNYNALSAVSNTLLQNYFCESKTEGVSNSCSNQCSTSTSNIYSNMFDYDMMDYRKVISITDFEEGSTSGINTLFTIEQTLAQQTYFSYAMGNYGFDLISWWTVKNWLETREKVLAIRRACEFDERTQYLKMYPEPTDSVRFYGALACYVERPLRDLIKEAWVYKYALALCKITLGTVRGKFGSTQAFGGQIFSQDMMQQGITERDALEQQLYTTSAGLGDADPVSFFIG